MMQNILGQLIDIKFSLIKSMDFIVASLGVCALIWAAFLWMCTWLVRICLPRVAINDFLYLISTESETPVFQFRWFPLGFVGYYYYSACVKGTRIWTVSKEPIEFPDSCKVFQKPQGNSLLEKVYRKVNGNREPPTLQPASEKTRAQSYDCGSVNEKYNTHMIENENQAVQAY